MIEVLDFGIAIPDVVKQMLSRSVIDELVQTIADASRAEWIRLAANTFHTTKREYIGGIQPVEFSQGVATIALVGMLPTLLEQGMSETDLHTTLLGPNVPSVPPGSRGKHPRADGGFYRAIPFRHSVGDKGAGFGRPYDRHRAVTDAAQLGRDVYSQAKKLRPATSTPYGGSSPGSRLPEGLAPKLRPHHSTDIFSGMIKSAKTYQSATQSQYTTFRTISTGSPGWIRPRTPGAHLAQQVRSFVGSIAPQTFAAYIGGLK